jgi:hypothetical protein
MVNSKLKIKVKLNLKLKLKLIVYVVLSEQMELNPILNQKLNKITLLTYT